MIKYHQHYNWIIRLDNGHLLEREGVFSFTEQSPLKDRCIQDYNNAMYRFKYIYPEEHGPLTEKRRFTLGFRDITKFFTSRDEPPVAEFSYSPRCSLNECPLDTYKTFRYTDEDD